MKPAASLVRSPECQSLGLGVLHSLRLFSPSPSPTSVCSSQCLSLPRTFLFSPICLFLSTFLPPSHFLFLLPSISLSALLSDDTSLHLSCFLSAHLPQLFLLPPSHFPSSLHFLVFFSLSHSSRSSFLPIYRNWLFFLTCHKPYSFNPPATL